MLYLKKSYLYLIHITDVITQGKYGRFKTLWVVLLLTLLFSFPNYNVFIYGDYEHTWIPMLEKIDDPFMDMSTRYTATTHASKLTFRITVPILANVLGLGMAGVVILQFIAGIFLLYFTIRLIEDMTNDRTIALMTALITGSIYAGIVAFVELRGGMFDGFALCFLVAAMYFRHPIIIAGFVFLASWTDERGLIASSLVFLFHTLRQAPSTSVVKISDLFKLGPLAVAIAWAAYFSSRFYLVLALDLFTPSKFVSLHLLLRQLNIVGMGIWTAFEGAWLLIGLAILLFVVRKNYLFLVMYLGALCIILAVAMLVTDVTRSAAYVLPALFIALYALNQHEKHEHLRMLCAVTLLICFLFPNYYAGGVSTIWWLPALPFQLLKFDWF